MHAHQFPMKIITKHTGKNCEKHSKYLHLCCIRVTACVWSCVSNVTPIQRNDTRTKLHNKYCTLSLFPFGCRIRLQSTFHQLQKRLALYTKGGAGVEREIFQFSCINQQSSSQGPRSFELLYDNRWNERQEEVDTEQMWMVLWIRVKHSISHPITNTHTHT